MEELKLLVEAIADLPELAIWVVAMYFFFKLAIVGSIFGVLKIAIERAYQSFKLKYEPTKTIIEEKETIRDVYNIRNLSFGKYIINGVEERLGEQIERLIRLMCKDGYGEYIHDSEVNKLIKFIDEYEKPIKDKND